jgi:hypothetical protein
MICSTPAAEQKVRRTSSCSKPCYHTFASEPLIRIVDARRLVDRLRLCPPPRMAAAAVSASQ